MYRAGYDHSIILSDDLPLLGPRVIADSFWTGQTGPLYIKIHLGPIINHLNIKNKNLLLMTIPFIKIKRNIHAHDRSKIKENS